MNEDVDVLFLASHTHKLGIEFTIRLFDGENSGDIFTPTQTGMIPRLNNMTHHSQYQLVRF